MSGTVLCVGALSLDTIFRFDTLPTTPGKHLPREIVQVSQGMATAQAASIVRLGGKAKLWASIGDDDTADRILADLKAARIDISAIRRVAGAASGFASIFMDANGERIIAPHYDPALRSAPDTLPSLEGITAVSVDVRWPDAAEMALRAAREHWIPGVLDVEIAPIDVLERLLPLATHIVASEHGARHFTGLPPAEAADALRRRYMVEVIVTAGERGIFWRGENIPAFAINAVDTLAAGDVFHGAFALGLTEGWQTDVAIRFASAAAAIKCTRFGGRLGAPTRKEVATFLARLA
ncbi:MAG: sugar kinase [Hyphomicrobiales bacterium]|nr:MAG: sugar kinase [Hyphomicrobiales bacterium]